MLLLSQLQTYSNIIEIKPTNRIVLGNSYYQLKLKGTKAQMYLREAVWMQLLIASENLPASYGFYLFDTYRNLQTQTHLFDVIFEQIRNSEKQLSDEECRQKTRTYVSDPYDPQNVPRLSHGSGGAVDLTLLNLSNGECIDMGTAFDDPSPASATLYFETQTHDEKKYRFHRNLLHSTMLNAGFTNYSMEWWHYDLGNYSWAKKKQMDWHYPYQELKS